MTMKMLLAVFLAAVWILQVVVLQPSASAATITQAPRALHRNRKRHRTGHGNVAGFDHDEDLASALRRHASWPIGQFKFKHVRSWRWRRMFGLHGRRFAGSRAAWLATHRSPVPPEPGASSRTLAWLPAGVPTVSCPLLTSDAPFGGDASSEAGSSARWRNLCLTRSLFYPQGRGKTVNFARLDTAERRWTTAMRALRWPYVASGPIWQQHPHHRSV